MNRDHAIVIGASVGGLVAARVFSSHFRKVTLIERDSFPPTGQHAHAIVAAGTLVFDRLFPGFAEELIAAGAVPADVGRGRWFQENGYMSRVQAGIQGVMASRPLLEDLLRTRLIQVSNIHPLERCQAKGVLAADGTQRVTGVRMQRDAEPEETLTVDATGRGSHAPDWLAELGYCKPDTTRIEVGIGYTTRILRRLPSHLDGDLFAVTPSTPQGKRGGVILSLEGNRWIVTLVRYFGDSAPFDLDGYRDFARTLPCPDVYSVVKDAESLDEPHSARFPASVRRHYEKLIRFPEGFLTFGDAICSFNPIYGQGMATSALESQALDEALREQAPKLAQRFFRKDNPWRTQNGHQ